MKNEQTNDRCWTLVPIQEKKQIEGENIVMKKRMATMALALTLAELDLTKQSFETFEAYETKNQKQSPEVCYITSGGIFLMLFIFCSCLLRSSSARVPWTADQTG